MTEGPVVWPYTTACDMTAMGLTTLQQQQATAAAVEWMWAMSGRQFGTRAVQLRPSSIRRGQPWGLNYLQPYSGYYWADVASWEECDPARAFVLELPEPVASVEAVVIESTTVDPSVWRVDGKWLVREDGLPWPNVQDMITPLGGLNTWAVNYTRGLAPDAYGQIATGKLICQIAKNMVAGKPCAVPFNATTVTRGGVTINRDIAKALVTTGITEVDQWVGMVNPNGLQQSPVVWSPDMPRNQWAFGGSFSSKTTTPVGYPSPAMLVLGPLDPIPEGTAPGTLIFRTE